MREKRTWTQSAAGRALCQVPSMCLASSHWPSASVAIVVSVAAAILIAIAIACAVCHECPYKLSAMLNVACASQRGLPLTLCLLAPQKFIALPHNEHTNLQPGIPTTRQPSNAATSQPGLQQPRTTAPLISTRFSCRCQAAEAQIVKSNKANK